MSSSSRPAGLYLHVPFCAAICPYCDFAVLVGDRERRLGYVEALLAEIELRRGEDWRFDTVYFGGGTPSLLEPEDLQRILAALRRAFVFDPDLWLALEANPEDVTAERAAAWRRLGVRMVSLGVQSLDASELAFLGRAHSPQQARRAVEIAREAGFDTVSLDLIYGLPDQTPAAWRNNLEAAIALNPHHLSCYQLTVEDQTVFGVRRRRGQLTELPDDRQADLFLLTHRFLSDNGYPGYEVSNFAAAPEHRSRHNLKYWNHTPYLGLGPSAHSFSGATRWWNLRKLGPWQRKLEAGTLPVEDQERLTPTDLALERLMLALRTCEGVDLEELLGRYGVDLRATSACLIERSAAEGLLVDERTALRPTPRGLAIADTLARSFRIELEDRAVPRLLASARSAGTAGQTP